jgi:hypothetical protein
LYLNISPSFDDLYEIVDGEALPDLNELPANEEEGLQIHETQQGISLGNGRWFNMIYL